MILNELNNEYKSNTTIENWGGRLVQQVDHVPFLRGLGVVLIAADGSMVVPRRSQHPTRLQSWIVLNEIGPTPMLSPRQAAMMAAQGTGLAFAGLGFVLGVAAVGTGVATAPFWVTAGLVASAASLGIAVVMTAGVMLDPDFVDFVSKSDLFAGVNLLLDVISLSAAKGGLTAFKELKEVWALSKTGGAAEFAAASAAGAGKRSAVSALNEKLRHLPQAQRNALAEELERLYRIGKFRVPDPKLLKKFCDQIRGGSYNSNLRALDPSGVMRSVVQRQVSGVVGNLMAPVASGVPDTMSSSSGLVNKGIGMLPFGKGNAANGTPAPGGSKPVWPPPRPGGPGMQPVINFHVPGTGGGTGKFTWYVFQEQPHHG